MNIKNPFSFGEIKGTLDTAKVEELHLVKNSDGTFNLTGKVSNVSNDNPDAIYDITSNKLIPVYSVNCFRNEDFATVTHSLLLERTSLNKTSDDTLFEMTLCE